MDLAYQRTTDLPFDQVVTRIDEKTAAKGFKVLHVHDVAATLAAKGLQREPYKIMEICNAGYANEALQADPLVGLMMPCKINVYREGGKTQVVAMRAEMIGQFFPEAHLEKMGEEVGRIAREIVDEALA